MMNAAAAWIDRKDLIEGPGEGLRVIEAFDDDRPRLTPSEVATRSPACRAPRRSASCGAWCGALDAWMNAFTHCTAFGAHDKAESRQDVPAARALDRWITEQHLENSGCAALRWR